MSQPHGRSVEPRDRSFGGKAGIWLKKRKQRIHPNAIDDPSEERTKVTPPSANNDSSVSSINWEDTAAQRLGNRTKLTVGWDDERCRPIYKGISTSSAEEDNDEAGAMETMDEARNDTDEREEESDEEEDRSVELSVLAQPGGTRNNVNRKTRAYGSQKRKSDTISSNQHVSEPKRQLVYKKTSIAGSSIMTPFSNRTTFDLATPQTSLENICCALNSETKATTPALPPLASDTIAVTYEVSKAARMYKKKKDHLLPIKSKKQPEVPSSLAELDFTDDNVRQPSSTTPLEAAKAFFERLDSQHQLTFDSSGTPLGLGKKCVRTRRAITVDSDSLREEYEQYASATKATGVDPLSMEQYAVNRSAFFRTGDMYDGFFDE